MHPLRFQPIFRHYLWGGDRLAQVLNKPTGDRSTAESWEIVDHHDGQSVVAHGPLAGQTLSELIAHSGETLLGPAVMERIHAPNVPPALRGRFPLLFKFLDAHEALSVQVHPDDAYAATLSPPDFGKTEAWVVMHADPGSKIYAGLKEGVSREAFSEAIAHHQTESVLHAFEPRKGDAIFIPAGTLHAIGAGLLIAEIQQASNTTFRVFDWDRVDAEGNGRPLHIQQALDVIDFATGPVHPIREATTTDRRNEGRAENENRGENRGTQSILPSSPLVQNRNVKNGDENGEDKTEDTQEPFRSSRLVQCEAFVLNQITLGNHDFGQAGSPASVHLGGDQQFHLLAVLEGSLQVAGDPAGLPLTRGGTMLLPASLGPTEIVPQVPNTQLLHIHLPPTP